MKICSIVRNSVDSDARVLKQAATLSKLGHEVTIFGLKDEGGDPEQYRHPKGFQVYRAPRKKLSHIALGAAIIAAAFCVILYWCECYAFLSATIVAIVFGAAIVFAALHSRRKNPNALLGSFSRLINYFIQASIFTVQGCIYVWKNKPDVVHAHDIISLPLGVLSASIARAKSVYDAHEIYEETANVTPSMAIVHRCVNHAFLRKRFVDGFITINESMKKYYSDKYPSAPESKVIMNATVIPEPFIDDGRLKRAAGLDESAKVILFQGGFSPKRGIPDLLAAAPHLRDEWHIVFMGWGLLKEEIERHSALPDSRVRIIGPAEHGELHLWTAGATVGVIPYEDTGLNHRFCTPNKLWEYPNAKVPIAATPRDELYRFIKKYDMGVILTEPVEPERMARELMLSDGDIAEKRIGCEKFIQANSWESYELVLGELYRSFETA